MTRILLAICLVFAVLAGVLYFRVNLLNEKNTMLQSQKNALLDKVKVYQNEIEEFNKAQERAGQTIEKVRTVIKTVKTDCDCWNAVIADDVRRLLGSGS